MTLEQQLILCDAVTSGGLLVAMKPEEAILYIKDLQQKGMEYVGIIGEVSEKEDKVIRVKE